MNKNQMRWRLYPDSPIYPWAQTEIFIGDFVHINKKGNKAWRYCELLPATDEAIIFGGVAMRAGTREKVNQIRVATTGGFEFPVVGEFAPIVGNFVVPHGPSAVSVTARRPGSIGQVYRLGMDGSMRTVCFVLHGTELPI